MVAIRENNYDTIKTDSKITDLNGWICKVKKKLRREKHKNLRLEVILTNTLTLAQIELRHKQTERRMKWINMKKSMDNSSIICNDNNNNCEQQQTQAIDSNNYNNCEDLLNLDNFMLQLKTIKQSIVR